MRKVATLETLTKLRLEPGDLIVVRDSETLNYLSRFPFKLDFNVPLVFSPAGVEKLTRADLLNLLEQLDQAAVSADMPEPSHSPL